MLALVSSCKSFGTGKRSVFGSGIVYKEDGHVIDLLREFTAFVYMLYVFTYTCIGAYVFLYEQCIAIEHVILSPLCV